MKRTSVGYLCAAIILSGIMYGRSARADDLNGVYLGASFGRAQNRYDPAFIDDQLQAEAKAAGDTLKYTSSSIQRGDNTWWVNAGYMPWSYVGIDAAFFHLGELTYRAAGELTGLFASYPVISTATVTSHGPALSVLARLPLTDSLGIDIRLGDYLGKTDLTSGVLFRSRYTTTPQSATSSSLLVSVGGAYTLAGHWSVRVDYLRINQAGNSSSVGQYNVNLATAGVAYTF
jgi:OmpA-like transmembrane domain